MAYICTRNGNCKGCPHYRYDEDRERMACFAQWDEQNARIVGGGLRIGKL